MASVSNEQRQCSLTQYTLVVKLQNQYNLNQDTLVVKQWNVSELQQTGIIQSQLFRLYLHKVNADQHALPMESEHQCWPNRLLECIVSFLRLCGN